MYKCLTYKPDTSENSRVWSARNTIYNDPGDEAMLACINRYLDSIEWVQLMSWKNDTDSPQTYALTYTTALTITEGIEVNQGFNLGATYEGMSIGYNYSERTFKSTETTSSRTLTITGTVSPRSSLIFYQRRYNFRDEINFICDAWRQLWNVGPWGGYSPLTQKNTKLNIMAEEYFTTTTSLEDGPEPFAVSGTSPAELVETTRKRENVTERCKNVLSNMGL